MEALFRLLWLSVRRYIWRVCIFWSNIYRWKCPSHLQYRQSLLPFNGRRTLWDSVKERWSSKGHGGDTEEHRKAEIWLLVLFLQSENFWYKVSGKCLKFKMIAQLALQTQQHFQCCLHKAQEDFVIVVLSGKNMFFIIWLVNVIHAPALFFFLFS